MKELRFSRSKTKQKIQYLIKLTKNCYISVNSSDIYQQEACDNRYMAGDAKHPEKTNLKPYKL